MPIQVMAHSFSPSCALEAGSPVTVKPVQSAGMRIPQIVQAFLCTRKQNLILRQKSPVLESLSECTLTSHTGRHLRDGAVQKKGQPQSTQRLS